MPIIWWRTEGRETSWGAEAWHQLMLCALPLSFPPTHRSWIMQTNIEVALTRLTQHMPIWTGVKGGKEWFYISSKFKHIHAEPGNQQWLCSFSPTNCLLLPTRVRWASSPLRGQCSTGAGYPQRWQRLHPCRFSGLSYVKPWLFCSRANNSHASSGKQDQLTPEALPTHILGFLSLFTTSVMVKWQNTIFYNTSRQQKEICYWNDVRNLFVVDLPLR